MAPDENVFDDLDADQESGGGENEFAAWGLGTDPEVIYRRVARFFKDPRDNTGICFGWLLVLAARRLGAHKLSVEPGADGFAVRLLSGKTGAWFEPSGWRFPRERFAPTVGRFKVMAGLDVAERRQPQRGRFTLELDGEPLIAAVSTLPTEHGEELALHLSPNERVRFDFDAGRVPD